MTMASHLGNLDLTNAERALTWIKAFKALARAKKWEDSATASTIADNFVASCGLTCLEKLTHLVAPREVESLSFQQLEAEIVAYLQPKKRLIVAERANFFSLRQSKDESIADFLSRLRKAATYCEFDSLRDCQSPEEEMVRLALLVGMCNPDHQRRILAVMQTSRQDREMSASAIVDQVRNLEQVASFVSSHEAASNQAAAMQAVGSEGAVHYAKAGNMGNSANAKGNRVLNCKYCGKAHQAGMCPAYGKTCSKCNKRNHFAAVCRSSVPTGQNVHHSEVTLGDPTSNSTDLLHLTDVGQVHAISEASETMLLSGVKIPMQVDTGASVSVLSSKIWEDLNRPELEKCNRRLEAYDGHSLKTLGKLVTVVELRKRLHPVELMVVSSSKSFGLLGRDLLDSDAIFHGSTASAPPKVEPLPTIKGVKAHMEMLEGARPQFCRARPVPLAMEEQINAELEKLQQLGVIEPVEGPVSNASPVVWVKKSDGSLRMCADYKVHVNAKIKSESYPIPSTEHLFAKLKNAKKFAKVDLRSAYWQIALDEDAQELSTINTSRGLFRVKRLQMGMKNASFIFQRAMECILADLKGILIYQDDVLVFAENADSLSKRLSSVKTRLTEKKVSVNEKKCIDLCDEITFLGFRISAAGIWPDDKLVEKIRHIAIPSSKKEVEQFLGLVNFFGRLIPEFSSKVAPLNRLRKPATPFIWSEDCTRAFESLKREISTRPVVQPYSLEKEVTLTTDASKGALAGVLTQEGHPVIFISRTLSQAEENYSNIEREALAVFWAVCRLKHYLQGRRFTIQTDHQPLLRLFGGAIPTSTSARISRWALYLMQFDFKIEYVPGVKIPHADALSRLPFEKVDSEPKEVSEAINCVAFESPKIDPRRVATELSADSLAQRVIQRVRSGSWTDCSEAELPFKKVSECLTIENGLLYMRRRIFIPARLRLEAFRAVHDTHSGVSATFNLLSLTCWWPGMRQDTEKFVHQCSTCARLRPRLLKSRDIWPPASAPFQRIHMDWAFVPEAGNILIVVDAFSGWIEAFPSKDRSADSVLKCLRTVFCRFGVPEVVVSDNGAEFTSATLLNWLHANGARKLESPPYSPQSNGAAERAVQTVKRALKAWTQRLTHCDFLSYLQKVLLHHRNSSLWRGKRPAELLFGRPLRVPVVSAFQQGDAVVYKPNADTPPSQAEFLMSRGHNTSWLLTEDKLRLASNNQIAPLPVTEEEEEGADEVPNHPMENPQGAAEVPRRSARIRRAPDRFVP